MKRFALSTTFLISACLAQADTSYTLTDLGTLGGEFSYGFGISPTGAVVGGSVLTGGLVTHPFLYTGASMIDLGSLGGSFAIAQSVNSTNYVAGTSWLAGDSSFHAFLYDQQGMEDLGTLGGPFSQGRSINASGEVVGDASLASGYSHAFVWRNGQMVDLGTLGGSSSSASGINNHGTIVGNAQARDGSTHAFLYDGTSLTDISVNGLFASANDVSDSGIVVGVGGQGQPHSAYWHNGLVTNIAGLGGRTSEALAVNSLGQIVGRSDTGDGQSHAYIFDGTQVIDLNTLVQPNSGWVLQSAVDINDGGAIVGYGSLGDQVHAFIAHPNANALPEPSSVLGLAAGLGVLCIRRRRRA